MSDGLKVFLSTIDLSETYINNFVENGYDRVQDIFALEIKDLELIRIFDEDHRKQIVEAASVFPSTREYKLCEWLENVGLGRYGTNFISNDFLDLEDIGRLEVEKDLYDDLEMVLPGHRKRLRTAVTQLRKRRRLSTDAEDPVGIGFWKKPQKLQDAKNPFLCIDATIKSTKEHGKSMKFEFMVDSGSDVATITEESLNTLDLELLGTIESRGVHSTKDKQLYKAKLVIGNQEIETEVIPEKYESIGNHAFRQFRHYINGRMHYWLKGDSPPAEVGPIVQRTPTRSLPPSPHSPFVESTPRKRPCQSTSEGETKTSSPTSESPVKRIRPEDPETAHGSSILDTATPSTSTAGGAELSASPKEVQKSPSGTNGTSKQTMPKTLFQMAVKPRKLSLKIPNMPESDIRNVGRAIFRDQGSNCADVQTSADTTVRTHVCREPS